MPVPFRDAQHIDELGTAAHLRIERASGGMEIYGGLLVINARGEPLQFTYTRATTEYSTLWRQGDIHRHAVRSVAERLFAECPQVPRIVLCLAQEIPAGVFGEDLIVAVPVCRIDGQGAGGSSVANVGGNSYSVSWFPVAPEPDSVEQRLFAELIRRNLVMDGFDRTTRGLREAYSRRRSS